MSRRIVAVVLGRRTGVNSKGFVEIEGALEALDAWRRRHELRA